MTLNKDVDGTISEAFTRADNPELTQQVKKVTYADKIAKMSNRQIQGELMRKMRQRTTPRMDDLLANVLLVMLANHNKGISGYLG